MKKRLWSLIALFIGGVMLVLFYRNNHIQGILPELEGSYATVEITPGFLIENPEMEFETDELFGSPKLFYLTTESFTPIICLYGEVDQLFVIYYLKEESSGKTIAVIHVEESKKGLESAQKNEWSLLEKEGDISLYQGPSSYKIEGLKKSFVVEYSANEDESENVSNLVEQVVFQNFNRMKQSFKENTN